MEFAEVPTLLHSQQFELSEIFFKKLFYESADLLLIYDFEEEKSIDVNEASLKFSGYSLQEFMNLTRYDLSPQYSEFNPGVDIHKKYLNDHKKQVLAGDSISELGIFLKKNGEEVYAEIEIIPTGRKRGEAFIKIKDLTQQLQSKSKAKKTIQDYKAIVESTSAGITIVDLKGIHTYVSPTIKDINGYGHEEMVGKHVKEFFEDDEFEKMKTVSKNLLSGKKDHQSKVFKAKHKNGHDIWVQGSGSLLIDKEGKPTGIQTVFIDISDKIALETELARTKTKNHQIIENLDGIFMYVDIKGHIEHVSPNYTKILGYKFEEVKGKKGLFVFCEKDRDEIKKQSALLIQGKLESHTSTYKIYHKDGSEMWVSGTFSLVKDSNGNPAGFVSVYLDVTERRLIEKELEKTKSKYQHIVESIKGAVTTTDLKGNITYSSPEISKLLGYKQDEILGENGIILFNKNDHEKLVRYGKALLRGKAERIQDTFSMYHKDGSELTISGTASVTRDKEGNPIGFLTVFFDISKEIALKKKLRDTEARYRKLFDSAIDPIIVRDFKTLEALDCNTAALQYFGIKDKGQVNKLDAIIGAVKDDKGNSLKELLIEHKSTLIKTKNAKFKVNYLDSAEAKRIIDINLVLDTSDQDAPNIVFFLKDITEQVAAFERLRKERELLYSVIEGTTDQIIVQDTERKVIAVNTNFVKKFKKMNNIDIEIGTNMADINVSKISKDFGTQEDWAKKVNSVFEGNNMTQQYSLLHQGKKEHYILSASPLKDNSEDVMGIISAVKDITEIIEKNEEIEVKNVELQKYIDSNIQLENFAYIASHDLKQPLRTIMSFSELLKNKKADLLDKDSNLYINFILDSAERLNNLVNDMLAYSIIGTNGEKEIVNPNAIIYQVMKDLDAQIKHTHTRIEISTLPEKLFVHKSESISLFQNIISNAIKYKKEDKNPIIKISAQDKGEFWQFSIKDNGQGIETKYLNKIFGMFQRLESHSKTSGTGIGLAHCKKILELHDGNIWAESVVNVGTNFLFTIPKQTEQHLG